MLNTMETGLDKFAKKGSKSCSANNDFSMKDLDDISSALSSCAVTPKNKVDDFNDLGEIEGLDDLLKKVKEKSSPSLLDASAHKLQDKDLKWAISYEIMDSKTEKSRKNLTNEQDTHLQKLVRAVDNKTALEDGATTIAAAASFTSEDWQRISSQMKPQMDALKHLPVVSLFYGLESDEGCHRRHSEHSKEFEERRHREHEDGKRETGDISITKIEEGVVSYDRTHHIKTTTNNGRTKAELEKSTKVTRDGNDETTTVEIDGVELYDVNPDGNFIWIDKETKAKVTEHGIEIIKDGKPYSTMLLPNVFWQENEHGILASAAGARTAEQALELFKKSYGDLSGVEKSILITRCGGVSVVRDGKIVADFIESRHGKRVREARFYIDDNRQLVQTRDNRVFIQEEGKDPVELTKEQVKVILAGIQDKNSLIAQSLKSIAQGDDVTVDPNVSINMGRGEEGITGAIRERIGQQINTINFHLLGEELRTNDAMNNRFTYKMDTGNGNLTTASGENVELKPNGREEGIKIDVKTRLVNLEDGVATFTESDVVVKEDGSVLLPNNTVIGTAGDVTFEDGSMITSDGRFIKSHDSKMSMELNQPSEKSMEIYLQFAKSIANSVAGRVRGGAVSLSDVALLRANLSILANYMTFFSKIGNLDVVNTLNNSWALVKDSLDQAEPLVKRKQEMAKALYGEESRNHEMTYAL